MPQDSTHLIVRTLLDTLEELGHTAPGLHFTSDVSIPLARGLGSSSAAIVAGLGLAWGLARPGQPIDRTWAFQRGFKIEGHGDNIGPAVLGGFTITWPSSGPVDKGTPRSRASKVRDDIRALALVPPAKLLTDSARGALPSQVPLKDAIANLARSALLVHALADEPDLLWEATADRLHQPYRAELAPGSTRVLRQLRERGHAAFISGAGPTVLVLHTEAGTDRLLEDVSQLDSAAEMVQRLLRPASGLELI